MLVCSLLAVVAPVLVLSRRDMGRSKPMVKALMWTLCSFFSSGLVFCTGTGMGTGTETGVVGAGVGVGMGDMLFPSGDDDDEEEYPQLRLAALLWSVKTSREICRCLFSSSDLEARNICSSSCVDRLIRLCDGDGGCGFAFALLNRLDEPVGKSVAGIGRTSQIKSLLSFEFMFGNIPVSIRGGDFETYFP